MLTSTTTGPGKVRFIGYVGEVCPDTGVLYYEAYLICSEPVRLSRLIQWFGDGHHFEPMHGSLKHNKAYCAKEDSLKKLGDEPRTKQDARTVTTVTGENDSFRFVIKFCYEPITTTTTDPAQQARSGFKRRLKEARSGLAGLKRELEGGGVVVGKEARDTPPAKKAAPAPPPLAPARPPLAPAPPPRPGSWEEEDARHMADQIAAAKAGVML